jgi:hypothetical protein
MSSPLRILASFTLLTAAIAASVAGCSPSSSEKTVSQGGNTGAAGQIALCKHEVAEKLCPICHPEVLQDPSILLCKEHGNIPEDLCTACHPELKAKYKTCEHELPPALCAACKAKNAGGDKSK